MRPVLKKLARFLKQRRKHVRTVRVEPTGEREVVGPLNDVDGIDLDESQVFNQLGDIRPTRGASGVVQEPLPSKQQPRSVLR